MGLIGRLFSPNLSKNDFAALISRRFNEAGIKILDYNEDQFRLNFERGDSVFLENCFSNYCLAKRSNRKSILNRFVTAIATQEEIPTSFAQAKPSLIPIIRSASYFSLAQLLARASGDKHPGYEEATCSFAYDLAVGLAYDTEHNMKLVSNSPFDAWNVTFAEALNAAAENLRERTNPTQLAEPLPGVFIGQWDDSYDTSRMLLKDMISRLSVHGDPVAFIPSRNQLLISGSKNVDGLKWMVELSQESHFEAYPLSPYLYSLTNNHWIRFIPDDRELEILLGSIERRRLALDYGQQKGYLEKIQENEHVDIFVASFTVYKNQETKREWSVCVWSKGVDSLLPITDEIVLFINAETKDRVKAKWEDVQSAVGHLMELQVDLAPNRYRVRSFPSETELAPLRTL